MSASYTINNREAQDQPLYKLYSQSSPHVSPPSCFFLVQISIDLVSELGQPHHRVRGNKTRSRQPQVTHERRFHMVCKSELLFIMLEMLSHRNLKQ